MAYKERLDGRKQDELRPIIAKAGVIKKADGSAYFKIGNTEAYAAVYGPRDLYPKFLQDPSKAVLRCHYNMMPFSGMGERVRPGGGRRSKEISMVTDNAIRPAIDLNDWPNAGVDVFIELPQTDAGSRCAGICAASIALADAGLVMKDLVSAVAIGNIDGTVVVDLTYEEESFDGEVADIPVAMLSETGEISLLQMDGELDPKQLKEIIEKAKVACQEIKKAQVNALKQKYGVEKNE